MRNHMERLVVLPFSFGCASHSSVQLGAPKKIPKEEDSKGTNMVPRRQEGEDRSIIKGEMKRSNNKGSSSSGFLAIPKPNVAARFQRLIRGIKSLSQLFFYKEDTEEIEHEMEIGYPTDVKHVTHIGLDGSTTTNNPSIKNNWDINNNNNNSAPEFLCLSPISIKQFELAMNAQAQQTFINHHHPSICG